ncbi:hypothetical protein ALC56_12560 [Trachymyrmex septentrionalis]|uniref:Uncharacterized protein n=1 Tax=Trachymyrmex septentrionalis TaxID=34720 RepID=A0A195EYX8_9HYME|nr:hypothetical protein ALC56_12560 [Trachymyrmex septentrionalis]
MCLSHQLDEGERESGEIVKGRTAGLGARHRTTTPGRTRGHAARTPISLHVPY